MDALPSAWKGWRDLATSAALRRAALQPSAAQQEQIAAQQQAFDYDAAEHAEILRKHEVFQAILMAHLKNDDSMTKKFIQSITE